MRYLLIVSLLLTTLPSYSQEGKVIHPFAPDKLHNYFKGHVVCFMKNSACLCCYGYLVREGVLQVGPKYIAECYSGTASSIFPMNCDHAKTLDLIILEKTDEK